MSGYKYLEVRIDRISNGFIVHASAIGVGVVDKYAATLEDALSILRKLMLAVYE